MHTDAHRYYYVLSLAPKLLPGCMFLEAIASHANSLSTGQCSLYRSQSFSMLAPKLELGNQLNTDAH